jgi:selenocysteine-specific elongation factor
MTVIATAGHIDHGKSSLVRALTGINPDRLAEERQRGMTIDLGFAHCTTDSGVDLSFIDVPGHVDFIRNMIAGVSDVDVVVLVVDAAEGWMPQTAEHCDIVSLLGMRDLIVAITKCDRVSSVDVKNVDESVRTELLARGISPVAVIPTSVISGAGIDELRATLVEVINLRHNEHGDVPRMRMYVDRVFTMTGAGTVVTGTLQGEIAVDQPLTVLRTNTEVRVRGMQSHGKAVTSLRGPVRCALNLGGIAVEELNRGDALVVASQWRPTTQCDVHLQVLKSLEHPVNKRGQFILHIGSSDQETRLRVIAGEMIAPGDSGRVRLSFDTPLPLLRGDRFVVRETGRGETIGGGFVLDAHPVTNIAKANSDGTLETYLKERGWVTVHDVWLETGYQCEAIAGEWIASVEHVEQTLHQIREQLTTRGLGLDLAQLTSWEKALIESMEDVVISHGVAQLGTQVPTEEQRVAEIVRDAGVTGPDATALPRDIIRRLVQRGEVYEHDGIAFHSDVLENLRPVLQQLWTHHPDGFSMAALRDATGVTRKYAVPLGTVLDKHGLTRRVGDVRIRGPRW